MIRFRTIDPAEQEKPAGKPVEPSPAVVRPAVPEATGDAAPTAASKGLTRKTPLRAKKPAAARPFRD